jgi:hypothetical protein
MSGVRRPVGPRVSSASPEEVELFVEASFAAFDDACREAAAEDHLTLAGRTARVRYAAPRLRARFRPALLHLLADAGPTADPDLTICCWDGSATAAALPAPPWRRVDFLGDSRIRGHIAGPVVATYDADGRLFQLYERRAGRALFHVADGRDLPHWHDRSPFRPLVGLWADEQRLALLHGATVAEHGAAVVLAGRSGTGKSTAALCCLLGGMDFLGDDACLVDAQPGTVSSVYGRAKLEPDAVRRLGSLDGLASSSIDATGASVLSPAEVARSASIRAVLLVSLSGRRHSELSAPLARDTALDGLVDTLRIERGGLTPAAVAALATVADAVCVRSLALGTDLAEVVQTVRGVLG